MPLPIPVVPPPPGIINARISKLILNDSLGSNRVGSFIYDSAGNPLRLHFLETATGNPYFEFEYDKYRRLSASISIYNNGGYEAWRRYFYDTSSRITLEVANIFGDLAESPDPTGHIVNYTEFKYDAQNRMIQYTIFGGGGAPTVVNCTYNAAGNLVNGSASYDAKTNYRRTNAIWMFLDRDYSLNNRLGATSYNAQGLPLGFHAVMPPQNPRLLDKDLVNSQIFY